MSPPRNPSLAGYRKKPLAIAVIAAIFLALPGFVLAHLVALSGGSLDVVGPLARSRYVVHEWLLSWSAAAAVYVVSRGSFAYFVGLSGYVLWTRLARLVVHPDLESPLSLLVTVVWLGVAAYVLGSSLWSPYLNPRLRWWTRPPRLPLCRDATLATPHGIIPVVVLNLSEGGAFVKAGEETADRPDLPQRLGERFGFTVDLAGPRQDGAGSFRLVTQAELVWKGKPESPYRDGMGIRFLAQPRPQRRRLHRYLVEARATGAE